MIVADDILEAHLSYLAKFFVITHDIAKILGPEDAAILRKYGSWFEALEKGRLQSFSEAQRRFISDVQGKSLPSTQHALLWVRYKELRVQEDIQATSTGKYTRAHGHF